MKRCKLSEMRDPFANSASPLASSRLCQHSVPATRTFFDYLLPGLPTAGVAAVGFYIVHYLSVRRQRRDEIFKTCGQLSDMVQKATRDACDFWLNCAPTEGAEHIRSTLRTQAARVSGIIHGLKERHRAFDISEHAIAFRQAITGDPFDESSRGPDRERAAVIEERAEALLKAADVCFRKIYR